MKRKVIVGVAVSHVSYDRHGTVATRNKQSMNEREGTPRLNVTEKVFASVAGRIGTKGVGWFTQNRNVSLRCRSLSSGFQRPGG